MSLSAYSISEDAIPGDRSLSPITDLGDVVPAGPLKKDVEQSWIKEARPDVTRGSSSE